MFKGDNHNMKKMEKALASLAIAGLILTMVPINAFADYPVSTRLSGNTAVQTAQAIAKDGWTTTSQYAVVAPATTYNMMDALAAAPLAAALNAPVLLTSGDQLSLEAKAEITRLGVKTVYVTSGLAVIKDDVIIDLQDLGVTVVSLGGYDQYETSVNIAKEMAKVSPTTQLFIANGESAQVAQDALSVAPIAGATKQPLLLSQKEQLPKVVKDYVDSITVNITDSFIIGGQGVISDGVKAQLPGAITRDFGDDAYDTNLAVLKGFKDLKYDRLFVANGETMIDALAGAPLAAQTGSPILLVNGSFKKATSDFLIEVETASTVLTALGGTAVVPEYVRMSIAVAYKPVIYLYPTTEQQTSVEVIYNGKFTCTYPEYKDGWEVIAHPDGTLLNLDDNNEYSYLFWEGILDNNRWDMTKGFVVAGKDTKDFLQDKLSFMGLTPKEYNEFIVFWLPKMQDNQYNLITFANEEYEERVHLSIDPNPDSVLRVFMVYKPIPSKIDIPPQQLTTFTRTGFSVVDWGGTEVSSSQ